MTQDELKEKMTLALRKAGKPEAEIEVVTNYILSLRFMQSDESRLAFFQTWESMQ